MTDRRVAVFTRLLTAVALWIARWFLCGTPFAVVRVSALKETEQHLLAIKELTFVSGHLTRAWHAGKKVRIRSEYALDALLSGQGEEYECRVLAVAYLGKNA